MKNIDNETSRVYNNSTQKSLYYVNVYTFRITNHKIFTHDRVDDADDHVKFMEPINLTYICSQVINVSFNYVLPN